MVKRLETLGGLLLLAAVSGCKWEIANNSNVEMAPLVRTAEVGPQPAEGRLMVAPSLTGGRLAYLRATPDAADHDSPHIFVESSGHTWEIVGLPYEGSPLENLHWEGEGPQALVVDRWFAPSQGVRIYVDMGDGAVFYAMPISREAPATKPG